MVEPGKVQCIPINQHWLGHSIREKAFTASQLILLIINCSVSGGWEAARHHINFSYLLPTSLRERVEKGSILSLSLSLISLSSPSHLFFSSLSHLSPHLSYLSLISPSHLPLISFSHLSLSSFSPSLLSLSHLSLSSLSHLFLSSLSLIFLPISLSSLPLISLSSLSLISFSSLSLPPPLSDWQ